MLHVAPLTSHDVRGACSCANGFGDMYIRLPHIEKNLLLRTKWTKSETLIGFNITRERLDPKTSVAFSGRLTLGKPYRLQVRVREESRVQILLDGKAIITTKVAATIAPTVFTSTTLEKRSSLAISSTADLRFEKSSAWSARCASRVARWL